jgi:hypothetical protein
MLFTNRLREIKGLKMPAKPSSSDSIVRKLFDPEPSNILWRIFHGFTVMLNGKITWFFFKTTRYFATYNVIVLYPLEITDLAVIRPQVLNPALLDPPLFQTP